MRYYGLSDKYTLSTTSPETTQDSALPDGKPITLINPYGSEKIHILEVGIVPAEGRIKIVASYLAGTKAVVIGEAVTQDSAVRYPVAFGNGVEGWLRDDYIAFE
jgi:hypothetical protein